MRNTSHSSLFPPINDRQKADDQLTSQLAAALNSTAAQGASPTIDVEKFRDELAKFDFNEPATQDHVVDWVISSLQSGLVQTTHPGYLGLFNPAPTYPSEVADRIAAAFNPQICVWSHAPVAVDIENHVIKAVTQRLGFSDTSGGHFTSGGSEANATALQCALMQAEPDYSTKGAHAFSKQARIYASAESHLAWIKIAHQAGLGRDAVCLINTDGQGRMDVGHLVNKLDEDKAADLTPVMIAATAGTTNAGMIDPISACAVIAKAHHLWLHVDAAWGGALIASTRESKALAGIEQASSVTIDAHKWFATTMGAGMFLTAKPEYLNQAFNVHTDYMPSHDVSNDYYVNSFQWSRRFIGLRLFLNLAIAGWEGYASHVEHGISLIDQFNSAMREKGWTVANNSRMAVTCLIPPAGGKAVEEIVDKVVSGGRFWVSYTKLEGTPVIRICITNGRTSTEDMERLADELASIAG